MNKKIIFGTITIIAIMFIVPLFASSIRYYDMKEGSTYYSNAYNSSSTGEVYGKLTNREDMYAGTNYSGNGHVAVITSSFKTTLCSADETYIDPKGYVECKTNSANHNAKHKTSGRWTVVYGASGYLYGSVE